MNPNDVLPALSGLEQIGQAFARAKAAGRAALMPYFTLGYPNPEASLSVIEAAASAGADLLELGVPFSDPLADGPTIQRSTQVALEHGLTLAGCLEMTRTLRRRGVRQPLLLMGYYNPILSYGLERLVHEAAQAGASGCIIPDLPLEEAGELESALKEAGLALVFMLAPTSTPQRIAAAAQHAVGFLYLVSLTGVTGARAGLPEGLAEFIGRVRQATPAPLAVGFGIASPEQARLIGALADGVIVGSALIHAVDGAPANPAAAAAEFVSGLRRGLEPAASPTGRLDILTPELGDAHASQGFLGC